MEIRSFGTSSRRFRFFKTWLIKIEKNQRFRNLSSNRRQQERFVKLLTSNSIILKIYSK